MSDRLVVHAHVPGSGSSTLNNNVFFRSFTRGETMLAYGENHCHAARLCGCASTETTNMLDRARFALGHVPYGYFDGFGRWTIYISIFDDPVSRFLALVGSVMSMQQHTARRLFGVACDAASDDAVGDTITALLDNDDVRVRHTNMMTRIAAGLPAFGAAPLRGHLDVARANVLRSNYLVATRDQLPDFEFYLKEVLGVQTEQRGAGGWAGVRPTRRKSQSGRIRREDVSAPLLRRIEAANDLDMRVYDAVQGQNATCWA
jgi:hypothetical protein